MLKAQMEIELEKANDLIEEFEKTDIKIRSFLSEFLGSYKEKAYGFTSEIELLKWGQIFFRLGREIENSNRLNHLIGLRKKCSQL